LKTFKKRTETSSLGGLEKPRQAVPPREGGGVLKGREYPEIVRPQLPKIGRYKSSGGIPILVGGTARAKKRRAARQTRDGDGRKQLGLTS